MFRQQVIMSQQPTFADKARSLYIHIGDADDRPLVSKTAFVKKNQNTTNTNNKSNSPTRGTFMKFHGIPATDPSEEEADNDKTSNNDKKLLFRGKSVGAGDKSTIGPDAVEEIQTRDKERIISTVRERRRRQLEARAAELAALELAKQVPTELSGEVLDKLNSQEQRRRQLLEAMSNTQWVHVVEIGRAAQISIALGERAVGRTIASSTAKRTTSAGSTSRRTKKTTRPSSSNNKQS